VNYDSYEYQEAASEFIKEKPEAAVFLDCGLGKTVITLSAVLDLMFDSFLVHRVLVIAPLRVAKATWGAEIEKWDFAGMLSYSVVTGTEKERLAALSRAADIYIINRENVQWLVERSGRPFDFDMIVVDELSSFKNHQAKRFRALMKVRPKASRIVGLTGTPSPNGLMDLFSEFKLLDMGNRLGRFIGAYRSEFFKPDRMNGPIVYSYRPLPGAEEKIYEKISDITISMKAEDHLKMPDLISTAYEVRLTEKEEARYERMKKDLVLELPGGEVTAANAAALSGKLTQMAGGAVYDDEGKTVKTHDEKLDALEDIIEAQNGRPLLIAYWYRHDLSRIEERLDKLKVTHLRLDSDENIKAWNEGKVSAALIHPASAGHGLNLQQGGSTIVWFTVTWSLELYQQTNARLWRQGQSSPSVIIIHLITKGTIDERIMKALSKKDVSQAALLDAVKADLGGDEK
jgi:SNF2 family DNA or RNA helicase